MIPDTPNHPDAENGIEAFPAEVVAVVVPNLIPPNDPNDPNQFAG